MKHTLEDSMVGLGVMIISVMIPVYLINKPHANPTISACVATSCVASPTSPLAERTIQEVPLAPSYPTPTPAIVAQAAITTTQEPQVVQNYQPTSTKPDSSQPETTTTPPPAPQPQPSTEPEKPVEQQPQNTQPSVVQQRLEPVQTLINNVTSLLH